MIIFIKSDLSTQIYNSSNYDTVLTLRKYLARLYKVEEDIFWLSYGGKILLDEYMLKDFLNPNCTIFINFRNLNKIRIVSGKNEFYIEYDMINNMKKFNFKRFIKNKEHNFSILIPEDVLDDTIFDNWYKIYNFSKSIKYIDFNKFYDKKYIKYLIKKHFKKILISKQLSDLKNLSILFDFINNEFYLNIINCFIAEYHIKGKSNEYLANLNLMEKN